MRFNKLSVTVILSLILGLTVASGSFAESGEASSKEVDEAVAASADDSSTSLFDRDNSKEPIEITADSLEVIQPDKTATFTGNVLAIQGDMKISSNKMVVYYKDSEEKKKAGDGASSISRIDVEGNVLLTTPDETARGVKGVYDVDKKHLLLLGDVVLTRGDNVLKGERLRYDMVTGRSVITATQVTKDGKTKKGRVRAVFMPDSKEK